MTADPARFAAGPALPEFLVPLFPFHRRLLTLAGGRNAGRRLHFVEAGPSDARPVLLLHGNPTWSFLWRRVIQDLDELRCVAPDLLGLGLSDRLPRLGDHTVDRHAESIVELAESLDLRGVILVGQDWGGPILAAAAARMPERIAGVVLANTAVVLPRHLRGTAFHRFSHLPILSDIVFRLFGFPLKSLHRVQGDPDSIRGVVARAYLWPLQRISDRVAPLALARMVPNGPNHPSVPALERGQEWLLGFRGPTALVWGTRDPILGRALSRHQKQLPEAIVRTTEAGHFLQEEVPEVLAQAIREVAHRAS
ncbi:MAG: alpha/beta fold hydrolase [Thermoanaerobaculia bacterium]